MRTDYYRDAVCPECGKTFPLTAEHALTNGKKVPVCSPHCSTAAWKREEARRQEMRERAKEKRRAYEQQRRERLKAQEGAAVKPHGNSRAVDIYTKDGVLVKPHGNSRAVDVYTKDGRFVQRYPSALAAAKATCYSDSWIRTVCRGEAELPGDYTYRYASEEAKHEPKT